MQPASMPKKLPQKNQYCYFGHAIVEIEIHFEIRITIQVQSFCRLEYYWVHHDFFFIESFIMAKIV